MLTCYAEETLQTNIPIKPVTLDTFPIWLNQQSAFVKEWITSYGFMGKPETFCIIPDASGKINQVIFGIESADSYWSFGMLPTQLPFGYYRLDTVEWLSPLQEQHAILAWGLGSFLAYPERKNGGPTRLPFLVLPKTADTLVTIEWVKTIYEVRRLINLSCEELGPLELAEVSTKLCKEFGATIKVFAGDELITAGYPAVYGVGRASSRAPHLIDFTWGKARVVK